MWCWLQWVGTCMDVYALHCFDVSTDLVSGVLDWGSAPAGLGLSLA